MAEVVIVGGYAPSLLNFRGPLIKELLRLGHSVTALAPSFDAVTSQVLTGWGVSCREVFLSRTGISPLADARTVLSLWRVMRAVRPDAVLLYTIKPILYGSIVARWLGVPRVYSMVTGLGYAFSASHGNGVIRRLASHLYRIALKRNDAVFFQNPDDLALFEREKLVDVTTRTVLINGSGVDLDYYRPRPLPVGPTFLLVARLLVDKGIREYVSAARRVRSRFPAANFLLVGWLDNNPNALTKDEVEAYEREGVVKYLGPAADVREAIALCRYYVLPSYREGTPRTVLEAMAMGRPIITTDAPGCRETVRDGYNGILVPVKDDVALAGAMERLLSDESLAARMAENSLILVREKYDCALVNAAIISAMRL